MGNCLVTKLKGTVNNPNLPYLNELRLFNKAASTPNRGTNTFGFAHNAEVTVKSIDGSSCFVVSTNGGSIDSPLPESGYVSEATLPVTGSSYYITFANVDCEIVIISKQSITGTSGLNYDNAKKNFGYKDVNQLVYMESLVALQQGGLQSANGVLEFPEGLGTNLTTINVGLPYVATDFGVNISKLPVNVSRVSVDSTKSIGDIGAYIRQHPSFVEINVMRTQVTGDTGDICEALKEVIDAIQDHGTSYTFIPSLNVHITHREGVATDNAWNFSTSDGGVTFVVTEKTGGGDIAKGTYSTSTHTWSD